MFCAESMLYVVKSFDKMFANNGRFLLKLAPTKCKTHKPAAISWQNATSLQRTFHK